MNRASVLKKFQHLISFSRTTHNVSYRHIPRIKEWESVVGLEIHAQILSKSKLFSGAASKFAAPTNSNVALFDCATPGTLPVLNQECVEAAVFTALALNCHVNPVSEFDRKHYFYADMPAGYQITQQRLPLASNGFLNFVVYSPAVHKAPYKKKSIIKQIQLEQDSGKSLHNEYSSGSLIDLNRAGVSLMEIVFEPDLSDGEEAVALVSELIRILALLKTCNCKMEEGSLRVDANVSVNRPGQSWGVRTEIKNLNSLRAVARSIDYEILRQIKILESGGLVVNETRGFDPEIKETISMRDKESKQDYRFMPEPNLPPLRLSQLSINPWDFLAKLPTLPEEERCSLMNQYELNLETALQLMNDAENLNFFKSVMKLYPHLRVKLVCNLFLTELLGLLHQNGKTVKQCPISSVQFAEVVELLQTGFIARNVSSDLLALLFSGDPRNPRQIAVEKGWILIDDQEKLEAICQEILSKNQKSVKAYRSGKVKAFNHMVSELKKSCKNQYDMGKAVKTLKKMLEQDTS